MLLFLSPHSWSRLFGTTGCLVLPKTASVQGTLRRDWNNQSFVRSRLSVTSITLNGIGRILFDMMTQEKAFLDCHRGRLYHSCRGTSSTLLRAREPRRQTVARLLASLELCRSNQSRLVGLKTVKHIIYAGTETATSWHRTKGARRDGFLVTTAPSSCRIKRP